ncbi:DUF962 domain-containing protein [Roseibium denhamense]|uniref:Uncharacterized membrane protein YGL010W n=1 Tax=Roseibium denhamense TaxID=76305 RepID=A0ABY1NSK2_9HYPH|nr:Mpo1-like protein [Roseibium denhamense]MTI05337.1 DUF962 domain-containing protein [Roseibium denhamense]SMP17220.1 Uncharacterized membrane protein YGL010W [Roseibium denhamense]
MTTHTRNEPAGRRIDALLDEYGESHQNATNKFIHWICVPVIVWTVTALLWSLPVPAAFEAYPYLNWSTIVIALATIYYLTLSIPLAFGMAVIGLICSLINSGYGLPFPLWQTALGVFVVAWTGQFVGHKIEGKKPSFFKDIQFLLIGPAWLLHFLYRKTGIPY